MAQPSEQPALDNEDRLLDLGLVASGQLRAVLARPARRCGSRIRFIR